MKRFVIAATFAVLFGLGTSSKADAQIVYGYSVPLDGGVQTTRGFSSPYSSVNTTSNFSAFTGLGQTTTTIRSPYGMRESTTTFSGLTGATRTSSYSNFMGVANSETSGINPFNNLRYGSGVFQPNAFSNPNAAFNYGFVRHR